MIRRRVEMRRRERERRRRGERVGKTGDVRFTRHLQIHTQLIDECLVTIKVYTMGFNLPIFVDNRTQVQKLAFLNLCVE